MMEKTRLPTTDSIEELARFWQEHDITDFEDELEEVTEPVLRRADETTIHIHLSKQEMGQLQEVAGQIGVDLKTLIHKWIHEKLQTA
ncbi:MAG: CopG family antitoxin [Caldilineaceae bacterium]